MVVSLVTRNSFGKNDKLTIRYAISCPLIRVSNKEHHCTALLEVEVWRPFKTFIAPQNRKLAPAKWAASHRTHGHDVCPRGKKNRMLYVRPFIRQHFKLRKDSSSCRVTKKTTDKQKNVLHFHQLRASLLQYSPFISSSLPPQVCGEQEILDIPSLKILPCGKRTAFLVSATWQQKRNGSFRGQDDRTKADTGAEKWICSPKIWQLLCTIA